MIKVENASDLDLRTPIVISKLKNYFETLFNPVYLLFSETGRDPKSWASYRRFHWLHKDTSINKQDVYFDGL